MVVTVEGMDLPALPRIATFSDDCGTVEIIGGSVEVVSCGTY